MKPILIYISILFAKLHLQSQTDIPKNQYSQMLWFGYYNSILLNEKLSVNSDLQFRTKNWAQNPSQGLLRTGLVYKINPKINLTLGLAHFRFFIDDSKTRGEWRPWQELSYTDLIGKFQLVQRLRIEQRFNQQTINSVPTNNYVFNWRFRYRLDIHYPIYKKESKILWGVFGNEIVINAGSNIVYNYFDQNRTFIGVNYDFNKNFTFQFQTMRIWQQLSNGITIDNISVIRFNIIHKIKG